MSSQGNDKFNEHAKVGRWIGEMLVIETMEICLFEGCCGKYHGHVSRAVPSFCNGLQWPMIALGTSTSSFSPGSSRTSCSWERRDSLKCLATSKLSNRFKKLKTVTSLVGN